MSHDDEVVEMAMLVMAKMRSMTIMKEENDDARDDQLLVTKKNSR